MRVALCERKIPSGAGGSPAPPHPGMITRMGSRALDFLQCSWTHIHMVATDIPEYHRRLGQDIQLQQNLRFRVYRGQKGSIRHRKYLY